MAQHQSFAGYEQSFDNCGGGGGGGGSELLGLQSGMEMLSLPPTGSLYPTQINQGLSLSLHHSQNFHHHQTNLHFSGHQQQQQQQQQQQVVHQDEGRIFYHQGYQLKNSMYLRSAQELLDEFCRLGGESSCSPKQKQKQKLPYSASSSWNQSLLSMDVLELQKRKALLLSMLEEVDQRYKRYKEQMQAVVSSFEAVAGEGSANVYSRLASKAMSKHFRCLRDGIVDQIQAMKKAMREKDASMVASGSMKGETPRLRLLDQCFRQQKAQAGLMESQPWRPQRGLPERSVTVLRAWLFEHFLHPYPSDVDKHILARQTGLSRSQVSNWFINARVRLWKPMVEEMYIQETKDEDNINESSQMTPESDNNIDSDTQPTHLLSPSNGNSNPNPSSSYYDQDQKPQLVAHHHLQINDSGTLSSIPRAENFGVVDLDFSSYSNNNNQSFGHGHGVSLTLGLQQSLMFSRDQFAVLGGDERAQNLPYRDLMGSQLLHDLAG